MPFCSLDFGLHFDPQQVARVLDFFATFILVCSLLVLATERRHVHVRIYALQSLSLAAVAFSVAFFNCERHIFIATALIFISKVIVIPVLLGRLMTRLIPQQPVKPMINIPSSLLFAAVLVLIADYLTRNILSAGHEFELARSVLTDSVGVVLLGLLIMIARKKALTQIIGFLTMENGLFLTGIAITAGMPLIVELGVLFDVLVAAFLMGVLLYRISETFDS
ncbi:hydrogenase, partial [Candidatus Acetothermia bacterium]|nr:hydrogenase [Candidatus Acetothermia bacterium]